MTRRHITWVTLALTDTLNDMEDNDTIAMTDRRVITEKVAGMKPMVINIGNPSVIVQNQVTHTNTRSLLYIYGRKCVASRKTIIMLKKRINKSKKRPVVTNGQT